MHHHFRNDYPRGPVLPTGELLNDYGEALNSLASMGRGAVRPGLLIGQARITDASDTGGLIPGGGGERDAPNADNNKYLVEFRFYNSGTQKWEAHDIGCNRLDAGAYHSGTHGSGPIPRYSLGDVVPVWFDTQRNWLVPLHSPPEQISSITFRAQESVRLPKLQSAPYIDTASICLELRRAQEWHRFLPELSLCPRGFESGTFGQCTVIVALRHYDELRLTGGTAKHSTAELSVYEHGLTIVPLARLAPQVPGQPEQDQPGTGEMTGANSNFAVLPGLEQSTTTPARFRDHATFTYLPNNKTVRVAMRDPFAQWMVAITYWAEVKQYEPRGVFLKIAHVNDFNELEPQGKLLEPIDVMGQKMHPCVLDVRDQSDQNHQLGNPQKCYVKFADYPTDDGDVVAEQGRIYGPCQYIGSSVADDEASDATSDGEDSEESSGVADTERPVFRCCIVEQEYLAKLAQTSLSKGSTGDFELYDRNEQATGIIIRAKALAHEIPAVNPNTTENKKWCILKRMNRVWYASQWECD